MDYSPLVDTNDLAEFFKFVTKNNIKDFGRPESFYDYYGAWKAGVEPNEDQHWTDLFKLPGHPTFSTESMYYKPYSGQKVGSWDEFERYLPQGAPYLDWVPMLNRNR